MDRNLTLSWYVDNEIHPFLRSLAAAVKSAKTHLLKGIGNTSLSYEDIRTPFAQIEMCLNSSPGTPMSSEPSDLEALTTGHFVVGSNLQSVPVATLIDAPENPFNQFEQAQRHLQRIWARWYLEYLQQLQSRAVQSCKSPSGIKIGQLVVVKEDCLPPTQWTLGKQVRPTPPSEIISRAVLY